MESPKRGELGPAKHEDVTVFEEWPGFTIDPVAPVAVVMRMMENKCRKMTRDRKEDTSSII